MTYFRGATRAVAVMLFLMFSPVSSSYAQEGTIQTDTLCYDGPALNEDVPNPKRWDASLLYLAFALQYLPHSTAKHTEGHIGIGAMLRMPLWRIGTSGEVFLRAQGSIGFSHSIYELTAGGYVTRRFFLTAGFAGATFEEEYNYEEATIKGHYATVSAGASLGSLVIELKALTPLADESLHGSTRTFDINGLPELGYYDTTVKGSLSIGVCLGWYI